MHQRAKVFGTASQVPRLAEIDEELLAIQLPYVLHVAKPDVTAVHRDVRVVGGRPVTCGHGIALPVDLAGVRELLSEEGEVLLARLLRMREASGLLVLVRRCKERSHHVGCADAVKVPRAMLQPRRDKLSLPVGCREMPRERVLETILRCKPPGG